jgi:hypothetical protein
MTLFSSLYGGLLDIELSNEDSTQLFTTARRKAAVNRGLREFAKLTECWQRSSTIAITGGTAEYDLNSTSVIALEDFVAFSKEQVRFRIVDGSSNSQTLAGDDLPRRDIDWLNTYMPGWQDSSVSTASQWPTAHYLRHQDGRAYLGFVPTPSTGAGETMMAVVPYVAFPPLLTADTSEPFTISGTSRHDLRPFHQAAVHFAAHILEKLRKDTQASAEQFQQFMGFVERFRAEGRRKGGGTVRLVKNYFRRAGSRDRGEDPRR